MKAGMAILRPLLAETGVERIGKVVIGTVKGDIHDIGKNLVAMMLEGAGFEVIDLGINTPVEQYPRGARGASARDPRHVGAAHDDDAVHEGRHRHAQGEGPPRRLHRARRRRAAERGVRQRRSAPTRTAATPPSRPRRRRRSCSRAVPRRRRIERPRRPTCSRRRSPSTRPSGRTCSSSPAVRSPARCSP